MLNCNSTIDNISVCRYYNGMLAVQASKKDETVFWDCLTRQEFSTLFPSVASDVLQDTSYWQKTDRGEYQQYAVTQRLKAVYPKRLEEFNLRETI